MGLPGVTLNVIDGNLNLQPANTERTMLYIGPCTLGTPNILYQFGDVSTMQTTLDTGKLVECAGYELDVAGGPVLCMPINPTVVGGLSAVTHTGTGAGTIAVASAPHKTIVITSTTTGALNSGKFTYQVGSEPVSQPVIYPSGHDYLVPGTYTVLTFPTHTYTAGETYTISTVGVVTYAANASGGTDGSVTQASSPIDNYMATVTITLGGALATAQFTYSLDGVSTSAAIVTPASVYAIPGSGIYLTFTSTFVAGDTYAFTSASAEGDSTAMSACLTALETTYLSAQYSMITLLQPYSSAANWATAVASLETAALALFNQGIYVRIFTETPTLGTITASGNAVVVDVADTDTVLETTRLTTAGIHEVGCAGDLVLNGPVSGLDLRRNCAWVVSARAASVEASQNVGFVGLGGVPGVVSLYRNENATPGLDAVGYTTMRTFPGNGLNGFFITDAHTLTATTSDYYPLTNARVIDRACGIARINTLPLINSKIPTTTRNNIAGVITEKKARQIEAKLDGALQTELVFAEPQDAVAASASVNRTHDILADGNLIIAVAVQPFAYSRTVTVNIGMAVAA
jgi:hypothetical protein